MTTTTKPRAAAAAPAIADPFAHCFNLEAERSVLAPVLDGRHADAWGTVREQGLLPAMFYHRDHRLVALVIDRLWADGKAVDAQSVADAAHRVRYHDAIAQLHELDGGKRGEVVLDPGLGYDDSLLAGLGGFTAIGDLAAAYAPATALARNAQLLVEYHQHRRVIALFADLSRRAQAVGAMDETAKLVDEAVANLSTAVGLGKVAQTSGECADEVLARHDRAQAGTAGAAVGSWGKDMEILDHRMPLKAGRMITLAGDTGGGKTSLALSAVMGSARKLGRGSVAICPLEQDGPDLLTILIAREIGARVDAVENGWLSVQQQEAADAVRREMHQLGFHIRDCSGASTIRDIIGWVHQRRRRSPSLHLVVLDHIGLIDASSNREREYETLTAASKALKRLTALDLCVLTVAQMNREGVKAARDRNGEVQAQPEPRLTDLHGSGSMGKDSDGVLMLWRRTKEKVPVRDVDIIAVKNRRGEEFSIPATFHAADGQRFTRRHQVLEPEDRRAAAAERAEKIDSAPGDGEDLFA